MGWVVYIVGLALALVGAIAILQHDHRRPGRFRAAFAAARWGAIAAVPLFLAVTCELIRRYPDGQGGFAVFLLPPAIGYGWACGFIVGAIASALRRR